MKFDGLIWRTRRPLREHKEGLGPATKSLAQSCVAQQQDVGRDVLGLDLATQFAGCGFYYTEGVVGCSHFGVARCR